MEGSAELSRIAARPLAGILAVVLLWPAAARPQAPVEEPATGAAAAAGESPTAGKTLRLGLTLAPNELPPADFRLFKDDVLDEGGLATDRMILAFGERRFVDPPTLVGLRTMSLGLSFRSESDEQGRPRLRIGPLTRGWDDLTPYEKFGLVLNYAAGLAGAAYMIGRLVD